MIPELILLVLASLNIFFIAWAIVKKKKLISFILSIIEILLVIGVISI